MALEVSCPVCSRTLKLTEELIGRKIKCPECQKVLAIRKQTSGEVEAVESAPRASAAPATTPARAKPRADRDTSPDDLVPCPLCAEPIKRVAIKCRHCGSSLDERSDMKWQGDKLLVRLGTKLPLERCVRCAKPASGRPIVQNLTWHPPWMYALLLVNLLLYCLVALSSQKKAKFSVRLCTDCSTRRKTYTWCGVGVLLASLLLLFTVISTAGPRGPSPPPIVVAICGILGGTIVAVMAWPVMKTDLIDARNARIVKLKRKFLTPLDEGDDDADPPRGARSRRMTRNE